MANVSKVEEGQYLRLYKLYVILIASTSQCS